MASATIGYISINISMWETKQRWEGDGVSGRGADNKWMATFEDN